jgi:hypothetical protein
MSAKVRPKFVRPSLVQQRPIVSRPGKVLEVLEPIGRSGCRQDLEALLDLPRQQLRLRRVVVLVAEEHLLHGWRGVPIGRR